jgi:CubicO group peptidase (beta-lactamase class C family)
MDNQQCIADLLKTHVARGGIAGAVALLADGDAAQVFTAGVRSLGHPAPVRRDDIFRIMSMTKPITAAAALMLVEEGRIALADPVERWLPELSGRRVLRTMDSAVDDTVPAARPIILEDLLTLRLGLGAILAPPGRYPVQARIAELGLAPTPDPVPFDPDEYMARTGRLPLIHQPGEGWMYHTGADILAVLIARVSGQPLDRFLRDRIFTPLRMTDTGFFVPAGNLSRLVAGYATDDAGVLRECEPASGGSYASPAIFPSELVSTADDYLAFARMLLDGGRGPGGQILSAASVRAMMTDHITPAQKAVSPFFPGFWDHNGWGYGGAVTTSDGGSAPRGSYGWAGGLGTSMVIDPATRRVVIFLSQRLMRGPADAALSAEIQKIALSTTEGDR